MDLTAVASSLQQAELAGQISTAVARKALDAAEQQGAAAISLLEAAKQLSDQAAAAAVDASIQGATIDLVV